MTTPSAKDGEPHVARGAGGSPESAEPLVFDATPLIYLAKAGALESLTRLANPFLLPPLVVEEVIGKGQARGLPEALSLADLVERGRVRVERLRSRRLLDRLAEDPRLSVADREALALAAERDARLIADEAALRGTARALDVRLGGSLFLLRALVDGDILSTREAIETLDRMIEHGWFCSPRLYASFVASLRRR